MWIREPTPVTTRHMIPDKRSIVREKETFSSPAAIQGQRSCVSTVAESPWSISAKAPIAPAKAPAGAAQPMMATARSPSRGPSRPLTRKPRKGSRGMRKIHLSIAGIS